MKNVTLKLTVSAFIALSIIVGGIYIRFFWHKDTTAPVKSSDIIATESGTTKVAETTGLTPNSSTLQLVAEYGEEQNTQYGTNATSSLSDGQKESLFIGVLQKQYASIVYKTYTTLDLTLATSSSLETIRQYGNAMGDIITKNYTPTENELLSFQKYQLTKDPQYLATLNISIANYQKTLNDFLSYPVPATAITIHLELLNSTVKILADIKAMQQITTDPINSILHVAKYRENIKGMTQTYTDVKNFFITQGISYTKNESGYQFVNVI